MDDYWIEDERVRQRYMPGVFAQEIRIALARERDVIVKAECWNEDEAREVESRLTPAERGRVWFTWLVFPHLTNDASAVIVDER